MPNMIAFTLGFVTFPAVCVAIFAILNYGVVPPGEAREARRRQESEKNSRNVSAV